MSWWRYLKGKVKSKEPLSKCCTFRIGGPADLFIEPQDTEELKLILRMKKKYKFPFYLLGAGSNLLIDSSGLGGVVVRLNSPEFKKISFRDSTVEVAAGAMLNKLVRDSAGASLSGLEFLIGVPGTVGGALVMNAGQAKGGFAIGDLVESARIMDYNAKIRTLRANNIKFGYRSSSLSKYIILSARLRLRKEDKKKINLRIAHFLQERRKTQGHSLANAGCIFANPASLSAGMLIDCCGLKGKKSAGAMISLRHANFILNRGNATSADVLRLMDLARKQVKKKFGLLLKPEIKIWQ